MDQDDLGNLIGMSQRNQTNQTLRKLEQQRRGVGACPHCGGGLPNLGVSVCMHCQKDLVWYQTVVGKPGQEALCRSQYDRTQASAAAGQAAVLSHRKKLLKFFYAPAFFLYIAFLLCCWFTSVNADGVNFVDQLITLCGLMGGNSVLLNVFTFIHLVWVILAISTPIMWKACTLEDTCDDEGNADMKEARMAADEFNVAQVAALTTPQKIKKLTKEEEIQHLRKMATKSQLRKMATKSQPDAKEKPRIDTGFGLFLCSNCNLEKSVRIDYVGKRVKCPKCQTVSEVFEM